MARPPARYQRLIFAVNHITTNMITKTTAAPRSFSSRTKNIVAPLNKRIRSTLLSLFVSSFSLPNRYPKDKMKVNFTNSDG